MRHTSDGFTLIEVLIVLAVIGVLAGIGYSALPRDQFAVRQAAEGLMRDVQLARFHAISRNTYVLLDVDAATDTYRLVNRSDGTAIKIVQLGGDSRSPTAEIASVDIDANDLVFDPRGVGIGLGPQTIVVASTASAYAGTVSISQQGRATIQW